MRHAPKESIRRHAAFYQTQTLATRIATLAQETFPCWRVGHPKCKRIDTSARQCGGNPKRAGESEMGVLVSDFAPLDSSDGRVLLPLTTAVC